jgi:hypothetical protein
MFVLFRFNVSLLWVALSVIDFSSIEILLSSSISLFLSAFDEFRRRCFDLFFFPCTTSETTGYNICDTNYINLSKYI